MTGGNAFYSDCGGADALELGGAILVVLAVIFFAASFVPSDQSRYK